MTKLSAWKLLDTKDRIQEIFLPSSLGSLNAASRFLPGGVYTTLRTYGGKRVLPLRDHIQRLEESARLAGQPVRLDRQSLQAGLGEALRRFPAGEVRIRISVDLDQSPGDVYLVLEPLTTPSQEEYERGILAVTVPLHRENPRSKQVGFIETAEAVRRELPPGANEALMVGEDGRILEGLSSNFFAVKDGILWTAEDGVLPGITRSLVLETVRKLGLEVKLEGVLVSDLSLIGEAFLTSSSRSVLPVRQIDDIVIGLGVPGPITKQLMKAYWGEIEIKLETLVTQSID
jgi:branched-chain amino acid aminotransferase